MGLLMTLFRDPIVRVCVALVIAVVVYNIMPFRSERILDPPIVNTTVGVIRGVRADDGSSMFLGIPYSVVNKTNPFGVAIPNPIFKDVFEAYADSPTCPQLVNLPQTSLECLCLNIHVPETNEKKPLPVLVYIYGGMFMFGSLDQKDHSPKFLIRHDVIFISFNYRMTAYGFMCLHTPEVPGNQGLKDQLNALRWIKANIRAFGGDDENITVIGSSSGAACADLQLLFADKGLFHKVISLSGTSLAPWTITDPDLKAAFKIASQLGFEANSTSEAITFLSNRTTSEVLLAANTLQMTFGPCIEKEMPNVKSFMTAHPVNTLPPEVKSKPILYGYTNDEMLPYINRSAPVFETSDTFNISLKLDFDFGANHAAMELFVRRFYTADEPLSSKLMQALCDFESDFLVTHPTQRTLQRYADNDGVAYYHVFSYVGGRNLEKRKYNLTKGGAGHADELGYLFDVLELKDTPNPEDQLVIDRITKLFTNFVKYGNCNWKPTFTQFIVPSNTSTFELAPAPHNTLVKYFRTKSSNPTPSPTELLPVKWLPVTRDRLSYLDIGKTLEPRTRPFTQRLGFWDYFYYTNREYIRGYSKET